MKEIIKNQEFAMIVVRKLLRLNIRGVKWIMASLKRNTDAPIVPKLDMSLGMRKKSLAHGIVKETLLRHNP